MHLYMLMTASRSTVPFMDSRRITIKTDKNWSHLVFSLYRMETQKEARANSTLGVSPLQTDRNACSQQKGKQ